MFSINFSDIVSPLQMSFLRSDVHGFYEHTSQIKLQCQEKLSENMNTSKE